MTPSSQTPTLHDPLTSHLGELIGGKWKVERVLGVGGMATVYYAVHLHTQRHAAIKVMHQEFVLMEDARQRFSLEARVANRINHPGAVPVLDDGILPDGAPYLVMEYVDGQSLQERVDSLGRSLSVEEAFSIAVRLLEIVEAAHQAGVLHRDIKPDNVYLTNEGEVKLLDFGISKMSDEKPQSHKTQLGSTMGTPAFMSPEQARGRWDELDPRADIFSVGATMYSAITGNMIHQAETSNELLLKVMTQPVAELRKVAPQVPSFAAKVVDRALAFEKKDRFASAVEMQQAVRQANERLARKSFYSLPDEEADWGIAGVSRRDSTHSTSRPVMFSQLTLVTIREGVRYARQKWTIGVIALLMLSAALISYSVVSSQSSVDEESLSPVAAHQTSPNVVEENDADASLEKKPSRPIAVSELPEEESPGGAKKADRPSQVQATTTLEAAHRVPAAALTSAVTNSDKAANAADERFEPDIESDPLSRRK